MDSKKERDKTQVASSCFELLHNEFVNQVRSNGTNVNCIIVDTPEIERFKLRGLSPQVVAAHPEPLVAQYHLDMVGASVGRRLCER